jgi:cellulose synthase/poly-beta-1,6-N-acetylglucosamine synthase-like glycosyltransferase
MFYLAILLTILYIVLVMLMIVAWEKPDPALNKSFTGIKVTVILAVRNEAGNILTLLKDLEKQTYPGNAFEVILVDDASTDGTAENVEKFMIQSSLNLRLIRLTEENIKLSPKKRALNQGIRFADGELIVTTDGDCRVGKNWISTLVNCYAGSEKIFISGPVLLDNPAGWFGKLQQLEFASLIGTGGAFLNSGLASMCNGANLAFSKDAFEKVNGYLGNENLVSGDDEFLLFKMKNHFPKGVIFLKNRDAIVKTSPQASIKDFYRQRIRWAGKWRFHRKLSQKLLAVYIFFLYLAYAFLFYKLIAEPGWLLFAIILTKSTAEWLFLKRVMVFFEKKINTLTFMLLTLFYPFYAIIIGIMANLSPIHWKGRTFKRQLT